MDEVIVGRSIIQPAVIRIYLIPQRITRFVKAVRGDPAIGNAVERSTVSVARCGRETLGHSAREAKNQAVVVGTASVGELGYNPKTSIRGCWEPAEYAGLSVGVHPVDVEQLVPAMIAHIAHANRVVAPERVLNFKVPFRILRIRHVGIRGIEVRPCEGRRDSFDAPDGSANRKLACQSSIIVGGLLESPAENAGSNGNACRSSSEREERAVRWIGELVTR